MDNADQRFYTVDYITEHCNVVNSFVSSVTFLHENLEKM